jgi:hypothetical protein
VLVKANHAVRDLVLPWITEHDPATRVDKEPVDIG